MTASSNSLLTRRNLLRQSFLFGSAWVTGWNSIRLGESVLPGAFLPQNDSSLLGVVPFCDEGDPPMGKLIGTELDGRLLTDLSSLSPENPLTPNEHFFIRTRASKLLDTSKPWTIRIGGRVEKSLTIPIKVLAEKSRPMGIHLTECSGNTRAAHFGLLSTASWEGVPLREVLEQARPRVSGDRVLVSGFDRYQQESMTSEPGASWIFTPEQLLSSHAFLATKMNGKPLGVDHGAPVRLIVPGWYGCVCIKWVNQIDYVSEDAPATSQMQEYASRTMQAGLPSLAREYRPAVMEPSAIPTRVEKWRIANKITYKVVGIQWGGRISQPEIEIRFNPDGPFVPVENLRSEASYCYWGCEWSPARLGRFTMRLRLNTANSTASRLDSGYYDRTVEITDVQNT